jgi:hypothetical protein
MAIELRDRLAADLDGHGAAYVPIVMYRATAVSVVRGEPSGWQLRTTVRHTCSVCGTRLFADPDPRVRAVTAYLLPPGLFRPLFHIRCRHALLPVKDALPHYADLPTFMGGSGETVDW